MGEKEQQINKDLMVWAALAAGWLWKIRRQERGKLQNILELKRKGMCWYARKQKSNIKKTKQGPKIWELAELALPQGLSSSTQYPYVQPQGFASKALNRDKKPMTEIKPSWAKSSEHIELPLPSDPGRQVRILEQPHQQYILFFSRADQWRTIKHNSEIFLTQSAEIGTLDLNIPNLQLIYLDTN